MVVARTQTLVQLTDELLVHLDARAAREGRSRSELIRAAITDYLGVDREAELDRLIVEGYTRQPQTDEEVAWADLGMRTLHAGVEPWDRTDGA